MNKFKVNRVSVLTMVLLTFFVLSAQSLTSSDTTTSHENEKIKAVDSSDSFDSVPKGNLDKIDQSEKMVGKSEIFYDSINAKLSKNSFSKLLYSALFIPPPNRIAKVKKKTGKSQNEYKKYKGLIIDSIRVVSVDFLHGSISDTTNIDYSGYYKIHGGTKDRIVLSLLNFKKGDRVDPLSLSESERYLRSKKYISDARILVVPNSKDSSFASIVVIKKDKAPHTPTVEVSSLSKGSVGLKNSNLVGFGADFNHLVKYNGDKNKEFAYKGELGLNDMRKSYISSSIKYASEHLYKETKFYIGQNFSLASIDNGWGVEISYRKDTAEVLNSDSVDIDVSVKKDIEDLWYGHAFRIDKSDRTKALIASGRLYRVEFQDHPTTSKYENIKFHNKVAVLGGATFQRINYFKSNYITSFGVTEDVPFGYIFQLNGGYEYSSYRDRPYGVFRAGVADQLGRWGYLSASFQAGGFWVNSDYQDAVIKVKSFYYSPLISRRRYHLRNMLAVEYTQASNLDALTSTTTKGTVRDIPSNSLSGTKKIVGSIESILFTPWYLYGFQFAPYVFCDLAVLTSDGTIFDEDGMIGAVGGGFRIKNESIVIDSYSLRVTYYLETAVTPSSWGFKFSTSIGRLFDALDFSKPEVLKFR
jgi:hypothetical protein